MATYPLPLQRTQPPRVQSFATVFTPMSMRAPLPMPTHLLLSTANMARAATAGSLSPNDTFSTRQDIRDWHVASASSGNLMLPSERYRASKMARGGASTAGTLLPISRRGRIASASAGSLMLASEQKRARQLPPGLANVRSQPSLETIAHWHHKRDATSTSARGSTRVASHPVSNASPTSHSVGTIGVPAPAPTSLTLLTPDKSNSGPTRRPATVDSQSYSGPTRRPATVDPHSAGTNAGQAGFRGRKGEPPLDMKKAFQFMDTDKSGHLPVADIRKALGFWNLPIDDAELRALTQVCKVDHDGNVSYSDFVDALARNPVLLSAIRRRGIGPVSKKALNVEPLGQSEQSKRVSCKPTARSEAPYGTSTSVEKLTSTYRFSYLNEWDKHQMRVPIRPRVQHNWTDESKFNAKSTVQEAFHIDEPEGRGPQPSCKPIPLYLPETWGFELTSTTNEAYRPQYGNHRRKPIRPKVEISL